MPNILLAYEFGSGLGHLNRLISVARRLVGQGRLTFAFPDLPLARPALERAFGSAAELRQGVSWAAPAGHARSVPTHTFADVITLFGFADETRLEAQTETWRSILSDVQPDLIIADFAPTLRLAVNETIPMVVVGNGYTVPPLGRPLPPMRPWQAASPATSVAAESKLLGAVNEVRRRSGGPRVEHVADLFSGEATFVCTLPEFDPYRAYRGASPTWPFNIPLIKTGPVASARGGPAIFAYMPANHPSFESVLSVLNDFPYPARVYAADADPRKIASRCQNHVGVMTKPADFAQVLPQCRLVIHHAGLGTAYAGLAAGTPQCVLPLNLEHLITARGLVGAGVAEGFSANESIASLRSTVVRLLEEPAWMEKARLVGMRLNGRRDPDPLAGIVAACERFLLKDRSDA